MFAQQAHAAPSSSEWEAGGEDFTDDRGAEDPDIDVSWIRTGGEQATIMARADLHARLSRSFPLTRYQLDTVGSSATVQQLAFTEPFRTSGVASVQFLQGKPGWLPREDRVTHKVVRRWDAEPFEENRTLSALFGPRGRPYGVNHVVLGNDKALHAMTRHGAELFLAVLSVLGPQYEGFFNGVAPGGPERLHSQYCHRQTTMFDALASPQQWPIPFWFTAGRDLQETAVWMADQVPRFSHIGKRCDFLYRFETNATFTAVCVPRRPECWEPIGALAGNDREEYKQHFGSFGVLEVAGCIMAIKSEAGFNRLRETPGMCEQALRELSR